MNSDAQLKNWYKFAKIHKCIAPNGLVREPVMDSLCYSIHITRIDAIINKNKAEIQLSIRVLANLFNIETKEFFGRTYESPFIQLRYVEEGYQHDPIRAYFHLRHSPGPNVAIIIEVVQFESKDQVITSRSTLGWNQLPFMTQEDVKLTLRRGSSRLLLAQVGNFDTTLYTMTVSFTEDKQIGPIKHLIPEACIFGDGDEILGLQGLVVASEFVALKDSTAFVTGVNVSIPVSVEVRIVDYLKRYKQLKYRDEANGEITITAKRLVVVFHNGWNTTNSRGLSNYATLEEGKIIQRTIETQKVDYRLMAYNGALDVNNVFIDNANKGVFIFQLEYDVDFVVTNVGKQHTTVVLGWLPLLKCTEFDEEFIIGPGKSINGQVLIDLSEETSPIGISGRINFGQIGAGDLSVGKPIGAVSLNQIASATDLNMVGQINNNLSEDPKDEKVRLKMLENTLKNLQQERQVSAAHLMQDFENKLKIEKQKEVEYQNIVSDLKKQHEEELVKITGQYDDLKAMMNNISTTQQQYMTRAQPTAAMAMLQQSVLYDQQEIEKWRIIESMTSVPRKTFYRTQQQLLVEAQFGSKNLNRADVAFLTQHGIRELFDKNFEFNDLDDIKQKSIQQEYQDLRQASTIMIQFLSFQPKVTEISQDLEPQLNYYCEEGRIPTRVEFQINFFDFPLFQTETLIYENGYDRTQFLNCIQQSIPLIFIREQFLKVGDTYKEPVYLFEVEPSQMNYPKAYKHFCEYLYTKCITIELWDSDAKMLFGVAKLPLRQLMRQGHDSAAIMKKVDIIAPEFRKIKGELQLIIKNVGKQDKVVESSEKGKNKRKVISLKTLDVQTVLGRQEEEKNLLAHDPNERIKERIRRFKMTEQAIKSVPLNEINRYKEIKKNAFVRSVIQDHIANEKTINPLFGKLEIVQMEFRNPYATGQNFVIVLDDQEIVCSGVMEVQLIQNASEWKYFVDTDNYPKPSEYNMIQVNNHNYSIFLNGKESVTLLFKYLTIREVDTSYTELQKTEQLVLTRGKEYLQKYCYPRQVAIFVNTVEGLAVGGLRVRIFPRVNVVDHIYRFYERDNRQVTLTFPAMYSYTVPSPDKRPILFCNEKSIVLEWANDFEIRMSLRIPKVNNNLEFSIFVYQDTYFKELIAIWSILLSSLAGVGIEVPLGQVQQNKLTVHVNVGRQVKFYSSYPLTVWFPPPYDGVVTLIPAKINITGISVRQFVDKVQKVYVNCVDINSKELVQCWILNISPTVPPVSQVFDVTCPRDQTKNFIVPYQNKLSMEIIIIFISSDPQILEPVETKFNYKAQQSQDIAIKIHRKGELDRAEVKLFVGDEDRSKDTYDCLLFRINYI